MVQLQSRELKGTNYGLNDEFLKDTLERRKQLFLQKDDK